MTERAIAVVADPANPRAVQTAARLRDQLPTVAEERAEVLVVVGGDGHMLQVLHSVLAGDREVALYGINRGTVGFLMNEHDDEDDLAACLAEAEPTRIHPLQVEVVDHAGDRHVLLAVNEVAVTRASPQSAKLRVATDGMEVMDELVGDGVLVATAAGSTAYNRSAGGPVVPLAAQLLAVTPIAAFHPRGWTGALLASDTTIRIDALEPERRPVVATADSRQVDDVVHAEVHTRVDLTLTILFDPEHGLEARILREQFRV